MADDLGNLETTRKLLLTIDTYLFSFSRSKKLDANKYFEYGIYSSIIRNVISFYTNIIDGNTKTLGLDCNCRSITELLIILELDKAGLISRESKQMYRYQHAATTLNNLSYYELGKYKDDKLIRKLQNEEEKFIKFASVFHKCEISNHEFQKRYKDPCFYLLKEDLGTRTRTDIKSIVELYGCNSNDLEDLLREYDFYSYGIHPHQIGNEEYRDMVAKKAFTYYKRTIDKAIDAINSFVKVIHPAKFKDVQTLKNENKIATNVIENIDKIADFIINAIDTDNANYVVVYFKDVSHLIKDMFLCFCTGQYDMVTTKFKTFIEMSSLLLHILKISDLRAKYYVCPTLEFATYLHYNKFFTSNQNGKIKNEMNRLLESVYVPYYKDKYNVNYDKFLKRLSNNMLYALDNDMTFNGLTNELFNSLSGEKKEVCQSLYKASNDMQHGSGLIYSQLPEISLSCAFNCLPFSLMILNIFIYTFETTINDLEKTKTFQQIEKYLSKISNDFLEQENDNIVKILGQINSLTKN